MAGRSGSRLRSAVPGTDVKTGGWQNKPQVPWASGTTASKEVDTKRQSRAREQKGRSQENKWMKIQETPRKNRQRKSLPSDRGWSFVILELGSQMMLASSPRILLLYSTFPPPELLAKQLHKRKTYFHFCFLTFLQYYTCFPISPLETKQPPFPHASDCLHSFFLKQSYSISFNNGLGSIGFNQPSAELQISGC